MNVESENLIPARRPSGRLSKPSMELLVDNQRLLSHYIEPKKKRKVEIEKFVEEINSPSNISEKSSISSKEKSKYKKRKAIVLLDKDAKSDNKELNKLEEVRKYKKGEKKVVINTDTNESEVTNGKEEHMDNGLQRDIVGNNLLNRRAYVAIEINNDMMKSVKSPDKSADAIDDKSEDDLPLSKIYPDFKPRLSEPGEVTRDTSSLPPKKKIKFVHFNELNGSSSKPQSATSSSSKIVPKLKLVFSPTKSSVMSMPKIPKKSKITNGSVSSTNSDIEIIEIKATDINNIIVVPEETNSVMCSPGPQTTPSVCVSPPPLPPVTYIENTKRCIRPSCTNIAIEDFRWDMEFCSPDCAIMYSKYIFNEWLNQRKELLTVSE